MIKSIGESSLTPSQQKYNYKNRVREEIMDMLIEAEVLNDRKNYKIVSELEFYDLIADKTTVDEGIKVVDNIKYVIQKALANNIQVGLLIEVIDMELDYLITTLEVDDLKGIKKFTREAPKIEIVKGVY